MNEMPAWKEIHPAYSGSFACTIHFSMHFDPEVLRRFVIKITLDYRLPGCATNA